ncbi:type I-C CRISPR-associated protein Cas8c/Csd1 [Rhodoferax sp.]|uniref:type I-C CRISPR-associated protein Cas8c/Csd1 n=1 Tax=Rhodoferax sp. TaxID=50421 RepID=UPI002629E0EE|nr:type I-C CRISPR-associated protein Cas8c/Csd1 [Rhodoferax sp.]MDD2811040.1 type I-C CRISPR-associated protein Cas8c/Csd1 [Rhodoferax sp.]MDD4942832.1 type I-C CRISPR-associated protein Cas8c/Csd1 [Rhodoferax sp.]
MILQALNDYYRRKCDDPDPAQRLPMFGLEQKEIPFLLEISPEGELLQLRDTRELNGKKKVARVFRVPMGIKKTSGVAANLLWDTLEYVLGVDTKGKPERVAEQHAAFRARIAALPDAAREDAGIQAVTRFLDHINLAQLERQPAWADALESNAVLSFRLQGDLDLVCQRPAVVNAALNVSTGDDAPQAMCLVTGEQAPVERLHASIKGVWGAQTAGANIVSFNARAFESYGKTERQGENAPVSRSAAFAYTTALNHLLRKDSPQRIQVGDASTVFWAERDSDFETAAADIFGDPPQDDPDRATRAVHALLNAVHSGQWGSSDEATRFYVLGLAPNAARISIRFYHCVTLRELGQRIAQHFEDLSLARGPHDPQYPSLKRLLQTVCLATNSQPFGDIDRLPPNLGGAIVDAIFESENTTYPALWFNAAVGRCRAEQAKKTQQGTQAQNVPYARAAVIKACLNRQIRRANLSAPVHLNEKEFLPMLDLTNSNPGYLLGRLFAVLERIQEYAAGGGGKLNSTIRDKYYGAMASSPGIVFPTLDKLKVAHLKKLPWGQKEWFEKLVGEILSELPDVPRQLSLPDQGRFALGYYHQRQDFFTKKTDDAIHTTTPTEGTPA